MQRILDDSPQLYIIHRFVSKSGGKSHRAGNGDARSDLSQAPPSPSLRTAGSELISNADTPSDLTCTSNSAKLPNPAPNSVDATLLEHSLINSMPLNTVVISQVCFKIGRVTVPPELVLAINGFTSRHTLCSRARPHPEWLEVKKIMSRPYGGHPRKLKQFLIGGWKDIPLTERWWETEGMLGGRIEEQRQRNLGIVERLRTGLESARTL